MFKELDKVKLLEDIICDIYIGENEEKTIILKTGTIGTITDICDNDNKRTIVKFDIKPTDNKIGIIYLTVLKNEILEVI